jgi:hypothetical protein
LPVLASVKKRDSISLGIVLSAGRGAAANP